VIWSKITKYQIQKKTEEMNQLKKELEETKIQLASQKRKIDEITTDYAKQKQQKIEEGAKNEDTIVGGLFNDYKKYLGIQPKSSMFNPPKSNPKVQVISNSNDGKKPINGSFVGDVWLKQKKYVQQVQDVDHYTSELYENAHKKKQELIRFANLQ